MESHIYPLNIEEPSPLSPKNKRKKPSFKEWVKERKKMIIFVCTVAVLASATVAIYATGLSDKLIGKATMEVSGPGWEGTEEQIDGYKLQWDQLAKEVEAEKNKTLIKLMNTGSEEIYIKARLLDEEETIESINKGILEVNNTMSISSYDFNEFESLTPGDYTVSIKVFSKEENMDDEYLEKETYLEIIEDFNFKITAKTAEPEPKVTLNQKMKKVEEGSSSNNDLALLTNTGGANASKIEALLNYGGNLIQKIDKGKLNIGKSMIIAGSDFKGFESLKPGDYTLTVLYFKKGDINSSLPILLIADFEITAKSITVGSLMKPVATDLNLSGLNENVILSDKITVPPEITAVTVGATPKNTNEVSKESSFLVKVTGGTSPYQFTIDFGDKNVKTIPKAMSKEATQWTFKHAYSKTGTYKILAKVTDNFGKTEDTNIPAYVITTVSYPVISSSVDLKITPPTTQVVGIESTFLIKVEGGTAPYQFNIDYGDEDKGTVSDKNSAIQAFTHTYLKAGTYPVKATVIDKNLKQKDVTVSYAITSAQKTTDQAVTLAFTSVTPASPQVVGTEVTFKLEATTGATSYNFRIQYGLGEGKDVNAGSKSNIATFKHKYTKAGTYTVSAGVTSTLNLNNAVHAETTYQITETKAEVVVPPPVETKKQCDNGKDDDGDDKVDYKGIIGKVKDPGCESEDDDSENSDAVVTPPPPPSKTPEPPLTAKETKCDDGKDNDNDGKKDYEDSDCKAPKDASIKITEVGVTSQKLNPALNAVKIYYKLSDSANVKVEMKNAKGDVTVPLFEGKQTKQVGNFSVWWEGTLDNKPNGQKAPDGTYTYKISATHLKYPSVKDSKEGTITVDSTYNPGGLDFEDMNNANLVGGTTQGQGTGAGQTPSTPVTPSQNQATVAIQSATTGSTAGTGPGVVIYFLFPLFAYAYKKIKY